MAVAGDGAIVRWGWLGLGFLLWVSEWIFSWSSWLGPVGVVVSLLWFIGLGYFVLASRSGRLPRALHTWGWMAAVLAIAALRAWWVGDEGLLFFAAMIREAGLEEVAQLAAQPAFAQREFAAYDSLVTSMLVGALIGLVGAIEAVIIAVTSWVGDLLREDRVKARVGLLPRITVFLLQAPIFVVMIAGGLAAGAGAIGTIAHPRAEMTGRFAELGDFVQLCAVVGVAAWVLAVVHLGRLHALAAGGRGTRVLLGLFAVAGAAGLAVIAESVLGYVASALWLVLQVAALRWARPK